MVNEEGQIKIELGEDFGGKSLNQIQAEIDTQIEQGRLARTAEPLEAIARLSREEERQRRLLRHELKAQEFNQRTLAIVTAAELNRSAGKGSPHFSEQGV